MSEPVDEFTRKFMRDFNKYLLPREKEITSRLKILEARNKLDIETLSSLQNRFTELENQMQVFIEEQEKAKSATVDLLKLIFKDQPVVQDAIKPLSEESQQERFGTSVREDSDSETEDH